MKSEWESKAERHRRNVAIIDADLKEWQEVKMDRAKYRDKGKAIEPEYLVKEKKYASQYGEESQAIQGIPEYIDPKKVRLREPLKAQTYEKYSYKGDGLQNEIDKKQKVNKILKDNYIRTPIKVTTREDGYYDLGDGHHRTMAARIKGDEAIPAIVSDNGRFVDTPEATSETYADEIKEETDEYIDKEQKEREVQRIQEIAEENKDETETEEKEE